MRGKSHAVNDLDISTRGQRRVIAVLRNAGNGQFVAVAVDFVVLARNEVWIVSFSLCAFILCSSFRLDVVVTKLIERFGK